jgi:4-hydroxybenzoate polyprenyltransferase
MLMQLSVSVHVWDALPLVRFVQFPWRLVGVVAFCVALLAGYLFTWRRLTGRLGWLAAAVFLAIVLYAGALAWTIGYDTIYAHQDREDDDLIGLKSTALRFGRATKPCLALLYGLAWLAITAAGLMAHAGTAFLLGMMAAAANLAWQVSSLDIDDPENCLERFRSNRNFGAIVLGAILLDMVLAAIF